MAPIYKLLSIMKRRRDTTVAINGDRKKALDDAVVKLVIETKQQIKMSEIVHHLIDNYLDDAIADIKEKRKQES